MGWAGLACTCGNDDTLPLCANCTKWAGLAPVVMMTLYHLTIPKNGWGKSGPGIYCTICINFALKII